MTPKGAVTILTVGLTGDVGAGKSTLSQIWREMGALIIDADDVAKNQWEDPYVRRLASLRWGEDFFTGEKRYVYMKISAIIFSNEKEYKFATQLIHEATFKDIERILDETDAGWVVLEIPLLYESGHYEWLDYVVYASAPLEKRIQRNRARGWDAKELERRERWLLPREIKIAHADFIIENNGTLDEWEEKARGLGDIFLKIAKGSGLHLPENDGSSKRM